MALIGPGGHRGWFPQPGDRVKLAGVVVASAGAVALARPLGKLISGGNAGFPVGSLSMTFFNSKQTRHRYKGKVVWVTGASSGIGEQLAYAFAREGASLILSARRAPELQRVKEGCDKAGAEGVVLLPLDLSQPSDMPEKGAMALRKLKRIDVLVNNGGVGQRSLALDTKTEVLERVLRTNFTGPVALTRAVLPSMLDNGGGQVVLITSLAGKFGTPYRYAFPCVLAPVHGAGPGDQ
eukprot:jgi/Mesvir1/25397/Mv01435-RA.1